MVVEMASDAGATTRPNFIGVNRCEICLNLESDLKPAKVLCNVINTFIESKAAFKCFDFTVIPLTGYITSEEMLSPLLLRCFLSNIHSIADDWKSTMVMQFLENHLALHPPCRPGMPEYYMSVLTQHLGSHVFDQQLISDTFFDFVKRLKVAINAHVTCYDKQSSSVVEISSRKDAIDFLKQSCKSTNMPKQDSNDSQLDLHMFVFNYCVDILTHDFQVSRQKNIVPLVVKIVWGQGAEDETPLNPHCSDIINMFLKAPEPHLQRIARYLTLLASVMQKGDYPGDELFWDLGSNELVDAFVQKLSQDDLSEESLNFIRVFPSRQFQCQIFQSLISLNLLNGADYPKKTALSKKNANPKKFFPVFDKRSCK